MFAVLSWNASGSKIITNESGRVIAVQLKAARKEKDIICYAPTAKASEEAVQEFYRSLGDTLKKIPKSSFVTIIAGDFNVRFGYSLEGEEVNVNYHTRTSGTEKPPSRAEYKRRCAEMRRRKRELEANWGKKQLKK